MSTQDFLHKVQPLPQMTVFKYRQRKMMHEDMVGHHAKHSRNTEEQKNL